MSNFPKGRGIDIYLPSCSSTRLSTQIKRRIYLTLKKMIDKEEEIDLELNRPLDKRHRTLSDQGLSCSVEKDQSEDKQFSSDDVRISTVNYSRSQSMPSLVESKVVFAEADSCYNSDHINPVEKKVHISLATVSNQRITRYEKELLDRRDEIDRLERLHKKLSAKIQAKTKLIESRTRSLEKLSDPLMTKRLYCPQSDISFPVRNKGNFNSPAMFGEKPPLSSTQAYQGYGFPFKSGSKRKTKNKHEETMGQDRLDGTKRSSQQEDRNPIDQERKCCAEIEQFKEKFKIAGNVI